MPASDLPSGLASISSQFDDTPNVRGAVDMAKRLRRAEALSALAEMDAPLVGNEDPAEVLEAAARARTELARAAIDRHAALAIGSGYKGRDRR